MASGIGLNKRTSMVLLAGAVVVLNPSHGAEEKTSPPMKLRMSGVLSNAAAAAGAAADAANAAAVAAKAAAAAATSAVEAINAVLPQSQRVAVQPRASEAPSIGAEKVLPAPVAEPVPLLASDSRERTTDRFVVPAEHTLAALAGVMEIPVSVSDFADFGARLSGTQALDVESANMAAETSLEEAIGAGRGFSREVLAAEERTNQAKAQSGQSLATLLPSLSVRKNSGRETSSPSVATDSTGNAIQRDTHKRTDTAWTLKQPLFDVPGYFDFKRRGVIELARGENRRAADGDAYLASVGAYLSLISTRLLTDMARDFERQLGELQIYIEKRAGAGASSVADMARVRARNQAAMSSRLEQESAHTAAGVEFVRLTNLAPKMARLPELEDVGVSQLPGSVDQAIEFAMERNPDIAGLASEAQAAEIDRSAAKSRFLPRLDFELTDNKSVHAQGDPDPSGQRDKRAMLVFSWDLFSGGSDLHYGKERAARHLELKYRLDDQRRRVAQSLSANYATLRTTRERLNSGYSELSSIASAAEAMSKRMLSGNQSLLDLLDTYERHYQAKVRLVNLHILEMASVAQIIRQTYGVPGAVQNWAVQATRGAAVTRAANGDGALGEKKPALADGVAPSRPQTTAPQARAGNESSLQVAPELLALPTGASGEPSLNGREN